MLKDLVTPQTANVFLGNLGDILEKGHFGQYTSKQLVVVLNLALHLVQDMMLRRFGIIEAFGSLRQCDLVVVQGTITRKMAPRLRLVYDQMPEPKYVIAMGACAITGGLYFDSYNVLPGIDGVSSS